MNLPNIDQFASTTLAPPPSCYCGADLSWFSSNECSEGCDWAGITQALDNPNVA